jgi:hypothetical protein
MEETEQGCALHTLQQYRETAARRGLEVRLHKHPIKGFPSGMNAYEYRNGKMIRWLCFFKEMPFDCTCKASVVQAAWKPTSI